MKDPRQIIMRPLVTEKSLDSQGLNQYCFEVNKKANKDEIKRAIEEIFDVKVIAVQTALRRGKFRRQKFKVGQRRNWKKAVVRLAPENTIDVI